MYIYPHPVTVRPAGQLAPALVVPSNWIITPTAMATVGSLPIAQVNTLLVTPGTTVTDASGDILLQVPNANGTVTPVAGFPNQINWGLIVAGVAVAGVALLWFSSKRSGR